MACSTPSVLSQEVLLAYTPSSLSQQSVWHFTFPSPGNRWLWVSVPLSCQDVVLGSNPSQQVALVSSPSLLWWFQGPSPSLLSLVVFADVWGQLSPVDAAVCHTLIWRTFRSPCSVCKLQKETRVRDQVQSAGHRTTCDCCGPDHIWLQLFCLTERKRAMHEALSSPLPLSSSLPLVFHPLVPSLFSLFSHSTCV